MTRPSSGESPSPLNSGQVYAVLDTLATETGNATYVGLSINDASTFSSPANVLDTGLKGSADGYASTVNNTDKLFVHYYTRDCTPLNDLLGDGRWTALRSPIRWCRDARTPARWDTRPCAACSWWPTRLHRPRNRTRRRRLKAPATKDPHVHAVADPSEFAGTRRQRSR
jgi:hypothetical protein